MPRRTHKGKRKGAGPVIPWNGKPAGANSGFKGYAVERADRERGEYPIVYRPVAIVPVIEERV
jgi:hypothetical protein